MAMGVEDDWEVVNDDGFVYKRKRRRADPGLGASILPPPAADPAEEERLRRERKRRILLKLKNRYRRELDQWEDLSNTMKAMEEKSAQNLQERERDRSESCGGSASGTAEGNEGAFGSVVDELLRKVEAQEAMICGFSNLCDVAEAMCNAEDERLTQSLIDLPIWASPGELMASLCDE